MAYVSGAESWSKERIMVEIRERQEEIRATRSDMEETESYHESNDYKTADSGWSNSYYRHMDKVQEEIDYLKSLL